ncbi:MAG: class III extradiol ring-cleavage dioxygenase [Gammaproteobacteria bacterium]|nr:class III extradiol ring-cleavage dioxygenase [Gammaproteobacteria bacterium]
MPASILYIPHGGGPLPLLEDPEHCALIQFLKEIPERFEKPDAILVVSAHWESPVPAITYGASPELIYDYGGFPPESYQIKYPSPGNPKFAQELAGLLAANGLPVQLDDQRGFDHGMFVPLKLMYPQADIPCVQLSLLNHLNAGAHIALGKALAPLHKRNILVLGSGMSFHNLPAIFTPGLVDDQDNLDFERWLQETCTGKLSNAEREERLTNWHQAPAALKCHPRPEHLLPLHVCAGIADGPAEIVFNNSVMGKMVSGYLWE